LVNYRVRRFILLFHCRLVTWGLPIKLNQLQGAQDLARLGRVGQYKTFHVYFCPPFMGFQFSCTL